MSKINKGKIKKEVLHIIKFPASFNLQNNNWHGIFHHVDRTFENRSNQDDNLAHINTKLSKFNKSTDGEFYNGKFYYSKALTNKRLKGVDKKLNDYYSKFIEVYNHSKSVKSHPKRAIKDIFKEKLLNKIASNYDKKKSKSNRNKLDVYQKTIVQNLGNTAINNKLINIIKRKKHESFSKARNQFIKAGSLALYLSSLTINQRHSHIILLHSTTNVDEVLGKIKGQPTKVDSLHDHYSVLGFSWTRLDNNFEPFKSGMFVGKDLKTHHKRGSKPSFSFSRALCLDERIHYSNRRTKVKAHNSNGYKLVNSSVHKALAKFRKQEGIYQTKIFNKVLKDKYHINFHLKYSQTHQKINGLSMEEERNYQNLKHLELKEKQKIRKFRRLQASRRRKNALNRKRTYQKEYHKHYRALLALDRKASSAVSTIHQATSLSNSFSESASALISSALSSEKSKPSSSDTLVNHEPVVTPSLLAQRSLISKINHQADIKRLNKQSIDNQYKELKKNDELEKQKEAQIQKQNHQIRLNQIKIEYQNSALHKLTSKFSSVIDKYRKSFTNIAKDTIKSARKSLKQTELQNANRSRATTSFANPVINQTVKKLRAKASSMPNNFIGKMRANFLNFKANRASSSVLQSLNNSVAEPVESKYNSWISERNYLNIHANFLYQEDYQKLVDMNSETPPLNSEQFSNAVKSATGLNLVQYSTSTSVSRSASASRAKPIEQKKHAELMKSLNSEHAKKMNVIRKKNIQLKNIERSRNKQQEQTNYWQRKLFNHKYSTDPKFRKRVNNIRRENHRGPTIS